MHWTRYATLGALMLVSVIGAIDAFDDEWDHFVLFILLFLLVLPLVTSLDRSRRLMLLRNDLADWVSLRSSTTGERPGDIIDRAVARHRDDLDTHEESATSDTDDG